MNAFDNLITAIEQFIDAKDDMWEESHNCNYNQKLKIKRERVDPAKDAIKIALDNYIETKIRLGLQFHDLI